MDDREVTPVLLCGGSGTRLWPVSRRSAPKQFASLLGGRSLFQETALRAQHVTAHPPVVVCNKEHLFLVRQQLEEIRVTPGAIVCEPVSRNTAPAVAAAAVLAESEQPDSLLLVLPSDHLVPDVEVFAEEVRRAAEAGRAGYLVTFGIAPTSPHVGYGYIRQGAGVQGLAGIHVTEQFVEKPDVVTAGGYVSDPKWLWNSGMFLLPTRPFLRRARGPAAAGSAQRQRGHEPAPGGRGRALSPGLRGVTDDLDRLRSDGAHGAGSRAAHSAAVERRGCLVVALGDLRQGRRWQRAPGRRVGVRCEQLLSAQRRPACRRTGGQQRHRRRHQGCGARRRHRAQPGGQGTRRPAPRAERIEADAARVTQRPWGTYEGVHRGTAHQVKHLVVAPGQKLSLQRHQHRAEHWFVVRGEGRAVRGDEALALEPNDTVYIPQGCVHRLENPGSEPLHVIEVQCGDYLEEDDIERLDDVYGRC